MNSQEWRKVDNREYAGETLHYTSCGLDNIFLAGGFTRHKTNYGEGVSIVNVEGLHRAIGESLIASEDSLGGPAIRFLRKEMKLTQEGLAAFLKVHAQQVARWEKGENDISGPADILIRALFKQYVGKQPNLKKIAEQLHHLNKHTAPMMVFESTFPRAA